MGILSWILFGALSGWLASIVAGTNRRQGLIMDIIVGVIGAFVGGLAMQLITGRGFDFGWNLTSFLVAVVGAVVLLLLFGRRRR
ncbi:MAG: GlsB/YeaQ/YmgE family stress response membrane protein [Chloroflexi bacterium]|nr:GlsB/YeaQ/YmgE family stress response membrane protein [Chloroflexota bacterium]